MERGDCYSSGDEYEENEEEMLSILCLFCDQRMPKFEEIFEHMKNEHCVDFVDSCKNAKIGLYGFYKVVNYVRDNCIKAKDLKDVLEKKKWDSDKFLAPVLGDDDLLMFDFDGIEDEDMVDNSAMSGDNPHSRLNDVLKTTDLNSLKAFYKDSSIERVFEDFFKLKLQYEETKRYLKMVSDVIDDSSQEESDSDSSNNSDNENKGHGSKLDKEKKRTRRKERNFRTEVKNLNEKSDSSYIDSYSHYGIHHEMLHDVPRTLAYKDAMLNNSDYFKGKTVLDIGCGTGILSMFAAKAGASLVVGVDQSDIAFRATEIVSLNKLDSTVKIIRGKLENIDWNFHGLPSKFDIIISEWMGYFLLFEGMLDTILFARDSYLNPFGKLLPNSSRMYIAAFNDEDVYEKNINFWDSVYQFNMSPMKADVVKDASIDTLPSNKICSTSALICDIDIDTCSLEQVQTVNSDFELNFKDSCTVHGLIGWFDCDFSSLPNSVTLSTSPHAQTTHWKQTLFYLKNPLKLEAGTSLKGHLAILRSKANIRALIVQFVFPDLNMNLEYFVD